MPNYNRTVDLPGKSAEELYDKISGDIDRFLTKSNIGKYDLDRDPANREVRFKASLASATLRCLEGRLELDVKLSLLAGPFRGKLDGAIDKWLAKTFA